MRTTWTTFLLTGLLCQAPFALMGSEPGIYFQENFRNYRDTAPFCTESAAVEVGNDAVWTQSAEGNCRMKESGFVFKDFVPSSAVASRLKNYDVLFRYCFRADKTPKFELRLRFGLEDKTGHVLIGFFPDRVALSSDGISPALAGEHTLGAAMSKNEWRDCVVRVSEGTLTVSTEEKRVMKQVLESKMPVLPAAGVNFYGFKDTPFSISDIVVREPGPMPDHSITNILPATLNDTGIYKLGAETAVPASDVFGATFRTGLGKDAVKVTLNWADGKKNEIAFGAVGMPMERRVKKDGKDVNERYEFPDAIIQVKGLGGVRAQINYHIRPMLRRYHTSYSFTDTYHDIIRDWDVLPKASEHPLKLECRRTEKGVAVYLDGCYAGSIEGGEVKDMVLSLAPNASIKGAVSVKAGYPAARYTPLDIAALRMAKSFVDAKTSLNPGMADVKGIPLIVASGDGSADIGLTRQGQGNWALEVDEYLARSPFDGLLTEVHFSVPAAPYSKAWVLCAVDPDPAKDPILTTRLAHYIENGTGNNTLADTVITLPRGDRKAGPGITQVGMVSKPATNGTTVDVPLYLVEVPLKTGEIIDLAMNKPTLNFEFFGKPWENFEQLDNTSKPDPRSTSAVQVFGVTLEKSPVGLDFVQSQPANVFANDEKPETTAVLKSFALGKGTITWEILDVDGKKIGNGAVAYSFSKAGEEQRVSIPLNAPGLGWYELLVLLKDETGKTLLMHPARFALLGKDERQARYESPYGTWWFDGAHNTPKDVEFACPIMFKAGIRMVSWTGQKEKAMEKWFITKDQANMPFQFRDLEKPDDAVRKAEEAMKKHLQDYPHLREVLVFHESGPGNDIPLELIGIKPQLSDDRIKREKRYADLLNMAGSFFREKFPQLKLVVGNNSCAQSCIAAILRHGGKPEYIDYIGIEAPSQVYIPEKLQEWAIQGLNIAKDTATTLSGRAIPATGCYEFTYRSERDMGEQQQAEWYTRDVLISLANNFSRIGPGILFDCSNAYYNGLWGGSGILKRGPYGYPKKAYVAYATITNVLDQVKLRHQVPTGSTTVYALEFDRADKKLVAALWAARGDAEFALAYTGDTAARVVDMYGRSSERRTSGGKLSVKAGTSPAYVIADKELKSVTIAQRSFPKDSDRARSATVVAPLDKADAVALDNDRSLDTPKVFPLQLPIRQLGSFEVRQVKDEQKGDCVELELRTDQNKDLSKYITEYVTVRLKQPAPIGGNPAALGVWVKGNSNWGRVMFEIEDAEGEVWRSIGTGGWGCDVLDWPGNISVNFDGWNFIALPLRDSRLFNDHSPGPVLEQWVSGGGNKKIDLPIKVRALIVEMNRKPLDLIDFKAVNPVIRLKDIGGVNEQ